MGSAIAWWAEYYRTHDAAQLAAALGHILSIAFAARHALGGDRAALRLTSTARRTADDIETIRRAHARVLTGLAFALITGAAQLTAQLDYLPQSPIFWTKMGMLALLLVNGRIIQLAGRGEAPWPRLRGAAIRSIVLWCTLVLLGLLLTTVRPNV